MSGQELFEQAILLEDTDRLQALALWRELATSKPTLVAYLCLGRCAKRLGLDDEAREAFEKALEIDNRSVLVLVQWGLFAVGRRDYDAAANYLSQAAAVEERPAVSSVLGVALRGLGKISKRKRPIERPFASTQTTKRHTSISVSCVRTPALQRPRPC